MPLIDDFNAAQAQAKTLTTRPSNDALLALYALYKQATVGDNANKRPGMLDLAGRAKHDAWAAQKGKSKDASMSGYVALVAGLLKA